MNILVCTDTVQNFCMCGIEMSIEILDQLNEILKLLHFANNSTCSMKLQSLTRKRSGELVHMCICI